MKNRLEKLFAILTYAGVVGIGTCLLLSELVFPQIEELSKEPLWYLILLCASFAVTGVGSIGSVLTKRKTAALRKEMIVEAVLIFAGVVCMSMALSRTEAYWKDVVICVGGTLFAFGFFCGIPTVAALLRHPNSRHILVEGEQNRMNQYMKSFDAMTSPVSELFDYHNGIYGEGHHCYFDNKSGENEKIAIELKKVLPDDLWHNYEKALTSYLTEVNTEEVCWNADTYYYQNGKRVDKLIGALTAKNGATSPFFDSVPGTLTETPLFEKGIKSGGYLEFQHCEKDLPIEELLDYRNITNWLEPSLYVSVMTEQYNLLFLKCWLPYFENPYGHPFDEYGINYYTPEETERIYRKIENAKDLTGRETFLEWMREANEKSNGFYILGV